MVKPALRIICNAESRADPLFDNRMKVDVFVSARRVLAMPARLAGVGTFRRRVDNDEPRIITATMRLFRRPQTET